MKYAKISLVSSLSWNAGAVPSFGGRLRRFKLGYQILTNTHGKAISSGRVPVERLERCFVGFVFRWVGFESMVMFVMFVLFVFFLGGPGVVFWMFCFSLFLI